MSKSQFSINLIGRTNIDAGTFLEDHPDKDGEMHKDNGVTINDTRLGVSGSFRTKFDFKIEICYAKKAISFRDVYVKYNIDKKNHLQFGNFFMPFGMKQLGLGYKFDEDASVDYAFCPSRKIGAAYLLTTDKLNLTGGIFSDGNIDNGNSDINAGLNLSAKAIFRPVIDVDNAKVLHFGFGTLYTNSPTGGKFSSVVPNTFAPKTLMTQTFDAPSYSRMEAELIFIQKKFLLEAHYQAAGANERTLDDRSKVNGFLVQASYILVGDKQNYNKATGLAANASPDNLELLCRYDHLNFGDDKIGVQDDFTIGLNYFISKNFNLKLNYANVSSKLAGKEKDNYNMIQVRAQFSFNENVKKRD